MAIEGPLHELAMTDLLQLLQHSRRSGTLTARGDSVTLVLRLREGMIESANGLGDSLRMGRLLVLAGATTPEQLGQALGTQRSAPTRRLGGVLETSGVSAAEIRRVLCFQIEEAVLELMRWEAGHLHFEERDLAIDKAADVGVVVSVDAVLMEAARRLDELTEITGSNTADPIPMLSRGAESGRLELAASEWEVLAEIDGERSLRVIAHSMGRGELEVARSIERLASAGVAALDGAEAHSRQDGRAGLLAEAEARLRRDTAPRPDDPDGFSQLVRRLEGIADRNVDALVLLARVHLRRGEPATAADVLRAALAVDPQSAAAHYHRVRVAVARLDLAEAVEATERYLGLDGGSSRRRDSAVRLRDALAELNRAMEDLER